MTIPDDPAAPAAPAAPSGAGHSAPAADGPARNLLQDLLGGHGGASGVEWTALDAAQEEEAPALPPPQPMATTIARQWLAQAANDDSATGARTLVADLLRQIDHLTARLVAERAHDPVTGAWSRAATHAMLDQVQARAQRDDRPYGLMRVAVQVPVTADAELAASLRDQVLPAVCVRLLDALRGGDVVGREGPAGFLCLLENCNLEAGRLVAQRCREAIGSLPLALDLGSPSLSLVSATIGLVMVPGYCETLPGALLREADRALLLAHQPGADGLAVEILRA